MKEKIKKISLFIIIFLFSFSFFLSVKATSGACSFHGGVNCSAGPDLDGSVICNDGWRDSNVSFYSADECVSIDAYCTPSELESLQQKYGVPEKIAETDSLQQKVLELQAKKDKAKDDSEKAYISVEISSLAYKMQAINYQLKLINDQINQDCQAVGYDRQRQNHLEQQKLLMEKQQNEIRNQEAEIEKLLEQLKASTCPNNSYYLDGKCYCKNGYIADGSVCITYTQYCQKKYGVNSYAYENYCYCKNGYEWDYLKTTCVKSVTCPLNSIKVNNECVCKDNYEWNLSRTECIKSYVCPPNALKIAGQCICNVGYEWDSLRKTCVKKVEEKISLVGEEKTLQLEKQKGQVEQGGLKPEKQKPEQKQKKPLLAPISSFVGGIFDAVKNFFTVFFVSIGEQHKAPIAGNFY